MFLYGSSKDVNEMGKCGHALITNQGNIRKRAFMLVLSFLEKSMSSSGCHKNYNSILFLNIFKGNFFQIIPTSDLCQKTPSPNNTDRFVKIKFWKS